MMAALSSSYLRESAHAVSWGKGREEREGQADSSQEEPNLGLEPTTPQRS